MPRYLTIQGVDDHPEKQRRPRMIIGCKHVDYNNQKYKLTHHKCCYKTGNLSIIKLNENELYKKNQKIKSH